jgi:hypothetical protein
MWHPRVRFKSYWTRTSLVRYDLNLTLGCHRFYYLAPLPVLDPIYLSLWIYCNTFIQVDNTEYVKTHLLNNSSYTSQYWSISLTYYIVKPKYMLCLDKYIKDIFWNNWLFKTESLLYMYAQRVTCTKYWPPSRSWILCPRLHMTIEKG